MLSNVIEFIAPKIVLSDKDNHPEPIKKFIPDWFKKISGKQNTVKNCMPFLDTLMAGYGLKLPSDIELNFNKEGTTKASCPFSTDPDFIKKFNLNLQTRDDSVHPRFQLEGSPILNRNRNTTIQKIIFPWVIKTEPGYSCLFLPPMNNNDDRFSIIPGIVDTDTYPMNINFPYVVNGDKYQTLDTVLKKGIVFAQCIPFKRESWKMVIKDNSNLQKTSDKYWFKWLTRFQHKYKKQTWNKKNFT